MNAISKIPYKGFIINVHVDEDTEDPSANDDGWLTTFSHWHKRYTFGKCGVSLRDEWSDVGDGVRALAKREDRNEIIMIPVAMMDHSGVCLWEGCGPSPFDSAGWDSGHVGYLWTDKKRCEDLMGIKVWTKKAKAKILEQVRGELKVLNSYVSGECYGYIVEVDPDGAYADCAEDAEDADDMSCWGFIGDPEEYMLGQARSQIDHAVERIDKRRQELAAAVGAKIEEEKKS